MTTAPEEPRDARQQLYGLIRQDQTFEEKAHDVLAFGAAYLGVDNGHLTRIDETTGEWTALVSTDTDDGLTPPALELDLRETYCRRTVEANEQRFFSDAKAEEWEDDPAFSTRELSSYLGTPLVIDGETCGTVCFVSGEPRSEPFTDEEKQFAELCAQLLERELERERVREERTEQTNLAAVLNRVLRHNLRNEMSVIRGFTELATVDEEDTHKATILDHIDEILELCGKARQLEQIITTDGDYNQTDIVELVEQLATTVGKSHPNAEISIEGADSLTTAVQPTFERAIRELIENAAKHGGEQPTVRVTVESVQDAVEITVADNGPGLSDQERAVLQAGNETPLTHGSGLGLWLAHWVITSHGGSLQPHPTSEGTVMTVSIPEKTAVSSQQSQPALTRARDSYHAAFEQATDGIIIVNDEWRIIDANPAAAAIFGTESAGLRGRAVGGFFQAQSAAELWAGSAPDTVTVVGDDGNERAIEYGTTREIVPNQHLLVCRDVTERVARETELSQKTQAIDEAPIGITLADPNQPDMPIVYANEAFCRLTGYEESEILGRNCRFLQGEETNKEAVSRLRHGIETETPVSVVLKNYRKDGEEFWNQVTIAPVGSGEDRQIVGFQTEVSDRTISEPTTSIN